MKRKKSSTVVYLIFFFAVFLAFCAFAVDGTMVYYSRAKLQAATESAALAGARHLSRANIRNYSAAPAAARASFRNDVVSTATENFELYLPDNLDEATITTGNVSIDNKQVRIITSCLCRPFFLTFMGVSGVRVNAVSLAVTEGLPVRGNYDHVNWLSSTAAYFSDIIANSQNPVDTRLERPLGEYESPSIMSPDNDVHFEYLEKDDNRSLSLGPGGSLMVRLPTPLVKGLFFDLFINEAGDALDGYFVFAGLDVDPSNPYVSNAQPGAGIMWRNISCSGINSDFVMNDVLGAYRTNTDNMGSQVKFYGSGIFSLNATCLGNPGISMVKYIKIVDDNSETAFVTNSIGGGIGTFYKAILYGEASTATAGADIDYIELLNHVRLAPVSQWTPDADG